jgi:hypothetical protein
MTPEATIPTGAGAASSAMPCTATIAMATPVARAVEVLPW